MPAYFMVIQDVSLITILPFSLASFKVENWILPTCQDESQIFWAFLTVITHHKLEQNENEQDCH